MANPANEKKQKMTASVPHDRGVQRQTDERGRHFLFLFVGGGKPPPSVLMFTGGVILGALVPLVRSRAPSRAKRPVPGGRGLRGVLGGAHARAFLLVVIGVLSWSPVSRLAGLVGEERRRHDQTTDRRPRCPLIEAPPPSDRLLLIRRKTAPVADFAFASGARSRGARPDGPRHSARHIPARRQRGIRPLGRRAGAAHRRPCSEAMMSSMEPTTTSKLASEPTRTDTGETFFKTPNASRPPLRTDDPAGLRLQLPAVADPPRARAVPAHRPSALRQGRRLCAARQLWRCPAFPLLLSPPTPTPA